MFECAQSSATERNILFLVTYFEPNWGFTSAQSKIKNILVCCKTDKNYIDKKKFTHRHI